jgi:hypothetical protein
MTQGPNQYGSAQPGGYGIEQALALLKSIPTEGLPEKTVVDIVRKTLESAGISIPALLEVANRRQDEITNEIVRIQGEIASLHQAIEEKTGQVSFYQEQLAEIGSLRERFEE